jgi:electron-transferring-flavoprotein dehydrogenase
MKSGMMAAEAAFNALEASPPHHLPIHRPLDLSAYEKEVRESWVCDELHKARNIRPTFGWGGLYGGIAYSALDTYLLRGKAPWTFKPRHAGGRAAGGGGGGLVAGLRVGA